MTKNRFEGATHDTSGTGKTAGGAYSDPVWRGDESGKLPPVDVDVKQKEYGTKARTIKMAGDYDGLCGDYNYNPGPRANVYVTNDLATSTSLASVGDPESGLGTDDVVQKWHGRGGFSGPAAGNKRLSSDNHPDAGTNGRTGEARIPTQRAHAGGTDLSKSISGGWGTNSRGGPERQGSDNVGGFEPGKKKFTWE